jgi:branched-chain amino acid transport system substrate-binding protein
MAAVRSFLSTDNLGYTALVKDVLRSRPDGVLLAAGAVDAAMICQQLKKQGARIPVLSCGWAMTDLFIQHGGRAVEGAVFSSTVNAQSSSPRWKSFERAYEKRFGVAPDFAAIYAYDAAQVLFQALARGADRRNMKETVLKHGRFQGAQGPFSLDKYGDPHRKQILVSVRKGRFESVE